MIRTHWPLTLAVALVVSFASVGCAEPAPAEPAPVEPRTTEPAAEAGAAEAEAEAQKKVNLPQFEVNVEQGYVDANGAVALREGVLELAVTVRAAKEHESVFIINGRPQNLHLALLMLGAKPGSPGRWEYKDKQPIAHDPTGSKVAVSFIVTEDGKEVERPITAAIRSMKDKKPMPGNVFVFAGSRLIENPNGKKDYLADLTGDVVTLVSFDGELLAEPHAASNANDQLEWEADPTHLPEVGTPVKLRFRPIKDAAKEDKTDEKK